jgi:hypothetical protein
MSAMLSCADFIDDNESMTIVSQRIGELIRKNVGLPTKVSMMSFLEIKAETEIENSHQCRCHSGVALRASISAESLPYLTFLFFLFRLDARIF